MADAKIKSADRSKYLESECGREWPQPTLLPNPQPMASGHFPALHADVKL